MRPTANEHQRRMRKLDRLNRTVAHVLRHMQDNDTALRLEFIFNEPAWLLSDGSRVLDEVARVVVRDRHVVAVDRGLFRDGHGQAWRYQPPENRESRHG